MDFTPALTSMTGFARAEGAVKNSIWVWEIKSVNAKGLDIRCRLGGFERIEQTLRERVKERFQRGNVTVHLKVSQGNHGKVFETDTETLEQVRELIQQVQAHFPDSPPPSLDCILAIKGLFESDDNVLDKAGLHAIEEGLIASFDELLDHLTEARVEEGKHLGKVIAGHLEGIKDDCYRAEKLAAVQPELIRSRLIVQISEMIEQVPKLSEERLAQEVALLMLKGDVREELDRLYGHCDAALRLLSQKKAVGRQLDFLCQELNREANTICSKSTDLELTQVGLALKVNIDQMREQVQNVE